MNTADTVTTATTEAPPGVEVPNELMLETRARIIHSLTIFPFLSGSMIQTALSPGLPPKLWRPILVSLIEEGIVTITKVSAVTPGNRSQSYDVHHLTSNKYTGSYGPIESQTTTPEQQAA
jgi:hypothetical protein